MLSTPILAVPESSDVSVVEVRPYLSGEIFVRVNSSTFCGTTVFMIPGTAVAKKEMYAAVLSALLTSKKIRLEALTSTGCNGWGTQLQSIYLQAN